MLNELLTTVLTDGLWLLIVAGWILLITIGLEVDKPLSGGIPGHVSAEDEAAGLSHEGTWGRIGMAGSWVIFGLIALCLPVALYWILVVHPR